MFNNLHIACSEQNETLDFALKNLEAVVSKYNYQDEVSVTLTKVNHLQEQSYNIAKIENDNITIEYSFNEGMMYAILDLATQIKVYGTLSSLKVGVVTPHVKNRGIKFNIPLDSRSPSYSDEADSAQKNIENMWDMSFWHTFIDELALNKYNGISLWSLAPFSSMVKVSDYPLCAIDDVMRTTRRIVSTTEGKGMANPTVLSSMVVVKKITIEEKIKFWQEVMAYAHERCVKFYVFTWNLFAHGTEGNPYGVDDNQDNPVTQDYFTKAVEALVSTYPLLAGVGVTSGERMTHTPAKDIQWIRDTYGVGVENALKLTPDRKFKFIHRLQYANIKTILDMYENFPCEFDVSVKYSQAHMHAAIKPIFTKPTLDALPKGVKTWLTVRNDDYYMFRWGDPNFAKDYIQNMPDPDMLEGFFMGPDGYTWGREYISKSRDVYETLVLEKMRYSFTIWAKIACEPFTDNSFFVKLLASEFGENIAEDLFTAWSLASGLLGDFQQTHWRDLDYHWYPEGCCRYIEPEQSVWFGDINEFMECVSERGTDRISVADYCEAVATDTDIEGVPPTIVASRIQENAKTAMTLIKKVEAIANQAENKNPELMHIIEDVKGLSLIGYYCGLKIDAAIELLLSRKLNDPAKKELAIDLLKECSLVWREYATLVDRNYYPQYLTRFKQVIDIPRFNEFTEFDVLFAEN